MRDAISNRLYGPLVLSGAIASFTLFGFALAPRASYAENARVAPRGAVEPIVHAKGTMNKQGTTFAVVDAAKADAGVL